MMTPPEARLGVALLGATGIVAQRFQQRLANHPWFKLVAVAGSERTAGRMLADIHWGLEEQAPTLPDLKIIDSGRPDLAASLLDKEVRIVFSALPSNVAARLEPELSDAGLVILSNASTHRHAKGVPLVIADLNPHHFLVLRRGSGAPDSGYIACSTNCTVVPIALPLKPLWDMVGFSSVRVRTEQALSGGGYQLLHAADDGGVDSAIPGEAEKISAELRLLLGRATELGNQPAGFEVDVVCKRTSQRHGHLVHVEVELDRVVAEDELLDWWAGPTPRAQSLGLPSAPHPPLRFIDVEPKPDRDRWAGCTTDQCDPALDLAAGMAVTIGAISVEGSTLRFSALADNTLRGAAGGCVLLGEMLVAEGLLPISHLNR